MPKGATAAPYKIFKKDNGKWAVRNNMGEEKAEFDSEEAARNYQKALYARVPGAAKAAEKKDYTGKQKRAVKIKASRSEPAVDKVLRLAWSDAARAAAAASRKSKSTGYGESGNAAHKSLKAAGFSHFQTGGPGGPKDNSNHYMAQLGKGHVVRVTEVHANSQPHSETGRTDHHYIVSHTTHTVKGNTAYSGSSVLGHYSTLQAAANHAISVKESGKKLKGKKFAPGKVTP